MAAIYLDTEMQRSRVVAYDKSISTTAQACNEGMALFFGVNVEELFVYNEYE
jgi:hypothetical protein